MISAEELKIKAGEIQSHRSEEINKRLEECSDKLEIEIEKALSENKLKIELPNVDLLDLNPEIIDGTTYFAEYLKDRGYNVATETPSGINPGYRKKWILYFN